MPFFITFFDAIPKRPFTVEEKLGVDQRKHDLEVWSNHSQFFLIFSEGATQCVENLSF